MTKRYQQGLCLLDSSVFCVSGFKLPPSEYFTLSQPLTCHSQRKLMITFFFKSFWCDAARICESSSESEQKHLFTLDRSEAGKTMC